MADDMPSRVAVLEQIARSTEAALGRIEGQLTEIRDAQRTDFRFLLTLWLSSTAVLLAVMAHGFKWL